MTISARGSSCSASVGRPYDGRLVQRLWQGHVLRQLAQRLWRRVVGRLSGIGVNNECHYSCSPALPLRTNVVADGGTNGGGMVWYSSTLLQATALRDGGWLSKCAPSLPQCQCAGAPRRRTGAENLTVITAARLRAVVLMEAVRQYFRSAPAGPRLWRWPSEGTWCPPAARQSPPAQRTARP
jgi:hypothetical protein